MEGTVLRAILYRYYFPLPFPLTVEDAILYTLCIHKGVGYRGYGLWGMGYGVWDMGYGIWDMGYGLWDMGYGVWDSVRFLLKTAFVKRDFLKYSKWSVLCILVSIRECKTTLSWNNISNYSIVSDGEGGLKPIDGLIDVLPTVFSIDYIDL